MKSLTTLRLSVALSRMAAFMLTIFLIWLGVNLFDMVAFGGAGRALLAETTMNGFQAFGVLAIGAVLGWCVGWRDGQSRVED